MQQDASSYPSLSTALAGTRDGAEAVGTARGARQVPAYARTDARPRRDRKPEVQAALEPTHMQQDVPSPQPSYPYRPRPRPSGFRL